MTTTLDIREATPAEVHAWLRAGEAALVDVRESDEFAREHVAGAVLNPLSRLDVSAMAVPPAKKLVIMCQSGNRSSQALIALNGRMDGIVYNMMGGINSWTKQGLPVERDLSQPLPIMRQVQIGAGSLVLLGVILGWFVNPAFFLLAGFVGAGLTFAGLTGFCGMATVLQMMPWNRTAEASQVARRA